MISSYCWPYQSSNLAWSQTHFNLLFYHNCGGVWDVVYNYGVLLYYLLKKIESVLVIRDRNFVSHSRRPDMWHHGFYFQTRETNISQYINILGHYEFILTILQCHSLSLLFVCVYKADLRNTFLAFLNEEVITGPMQLALHHEF